MTTHSYPDTLLLINGTWQPAASGRTTAVVNPATGLTIGTYAHAGLEDLEAAAESVAKGFASWRRVSAFDRSRMMRKAADLLRERLDVIARVMTMEQGKVLAEARAEILAGADTIDWFAEEARRTYGRIVPARSEGVQQLIVKEPIGPVAAFTPWNFPVNQVVRKLAAALAAGCSIVVKAPEETPACRRARSIWSTATPPRSHPSSLPTRRSAKFPSRDRRWSASNLRRLPACT